MIERGGEVLGPAAVALIKTHHVYAHFVGQFSGAHNVGGGIGSPEAVNKDQRGARNPVLLSATAGEQPHPRFYLEEAFLVHSMGAVQSLEQRMGLERSSRDQVRYIAQAWVGVVWWCMGTHVICGPCSVSSSTASPSPYRPYSADRGSADDLEVEDGLLERAEQPHPDR